MRIDKKNELQWLLHSPICHRRRIRGGEPEDGSDAVIDGDATVLVHVRPGEVEKVRDGACGDDDGVGEDSGVRSDVEGADEEVDDNDDLGDDVSHVAMSLGI
jgi:hypothetical protein